MVWKVAKNCVVRSAEFIIGRKLPALQDTYHTCCLRKAGRILRDLTPIPQSLYPVAFWQALPQHSVTYTQTGQQFLSKDHQASEWKLIWTHFTLVTSHTVKILEYEQFKVVFLKRGAVPTICSSQPRVVVNSYSNDLLYLA